MAFFGTYEDGQTALLSQFSVCAAAKMKQLLDLSEYIFCLASQTVQIHVTSHAPRPIKLPELMSQTSMLESGLRLFSEGIQKA